MIGELSCRLFLNKLVSPFQARVKSQACKSQDTRESQESVIMIVFQFRLLAWEAVIRNELRLGIGLSIINAQSSNVIEKPIPQATTHVMIDMLMIDRPIAFTTLTGEGM